ncbi:MAG: V-type ATP synthase subunit E family protein [Candidatus Bathyarchaeia archaeon]
MSDALSVIKSEIMKRSLEEAQGIIAQAEREAEEIISSARKKAEEILERSIKPEILVMKKRILGSARLEGRRALLKAKEEVLSKVFKKVEERLERIAEGKDPEYRYEDLVEKFILEAASRIGERELTLKSNMKTLALIKKNLKKIENRLEKALGYKIKLTLEKNPFNCLGGIVVYTPDGTRIFYNTLEGRMVGLKEALRGMVAKILFT